MGDSDTSLLLSLKHPQPSIRVLAVEHLMSIITNEQARQEASSPVSNSRENDCCNSRAIPICPEQHHSLTGTFLKDAVTNHLRDDVPEVVSATLKLVEVSEEGVEIFPPTGQLRYCSLCAFMSFQLLYDILDPEHIVTCLLSMLHRPEASAEEWSVKYTKLGFNLNLSN